jgi:hypothetical protein
LAREIQILQNDLEVQWTTSRVLDLLPDGSTPGFDNDPPEGHLEPGMVVDHWRSTTIAYLFIRQLFALGAALWSPWVAGLVFLGLMIPVYSLRPALLALAISVQKLDCFTESGRGG